MPQKHKILRRKKTSSKRNIVLVRVKQQLWPSIVMFTNRWSVGITCSRKHMRIKREREREREVVMLYEQSWKMFLLLNYTISKYFYFLLVVKLKATTHLKCQKPRIALFRFPASCNNVLFHHTQTSSRARSVSPSHSKAAFPSGVRRNDWRVKKNVKVKLSHYRLGQALRATGVWDSQNF